MSKEETVYIDGDNLPYRVGFATQRTIYILDKEGEHSCSPVLVTKEKRRVNKYTKADPSLLVSERFMVEDPIQAILTLKLAIQGIVKESKCKFFKVVLSGDTNFREEIATIQPYKGNRVDFEKPHHWQMLRDWLLDMPYTIVSDNEEADDVVSRAIWEGYVGASNDKDLNNTPGWHYNFNTKEKYYVTPEEAMYNFYAQMLTGDTADHIPGIKGIGPKKAQDLLEGCNTPETYETKVLEVYERVYDSPLNAMIEVGQLLWMRREENEMWYPSIDAVL